jgi:hypothetical protein
MNVGSGSQNVAGRDVIAGNRFDADPEVAREIETLRQALAGLRLTAGERETAETNLASLAEAGDKKTAAGHLESFVTGLKRAGVVAAAGASFAQAVTTLAHCIGPLAAGVVALL